MERRLIRGFFDIYRFIIESKINVVHANFSPAADLCIFAAKLAGVKKIINHFRSVSERKGTGIRAWYLTHFNDINIAVSEAVKKNLIERGAPKDRVHVLYNGIEISSVPKSKKEAYELLSLECPSSVIMCIAWNDPVKGADLLLEAFSKIVRKFQDVKLWIVGEACNSSNSRELAEKLGIQDHVVWLGIRNDIPILLNCCDIYVQPSRMEAFPLAVAEAMAAGKPVAAFRVGGLPEAVEDGVTGLLAEPENIVSLSEAIIRLLENPELREKMGKAGRKRALQMFDVNKETSQTIDWYEKI
jgi:glycosyltransferase involved in cell wall biosynthesis